MKQLLFPAFLLLFAVINTSGQCPNTNPNTFCTTLNGAGLTLNTITEICDMVPGDYQEVSNLVAGNTYRFSFCNPSSNNPPPTTYNSFMTVYGPGGFVAFNDDFCGTNSQVEFVAPASGTYRILCNVSGNCSSTPFTFTPATITLVNVPSSSATVSSINRASANPTNAGLVNYTVTFSGSVAGLSAGNFSLTTTGGITGASVGTPTGSGTTWTVPVNTGTGDGTIRLDLVNATGLSPSVTTPYTSGQVYDVDKTGPGIVIGAPSANSASCGSVTYTVTYTGAGTISLANGNITLNTTGNASASVAVSGSGTSVRTVTLNNFTGTGTLGISIAANTATDALGNNALTAGPSTTFTVSPPPSAAISYSGSPFCNAGTANISLSGSSGGTFSSTSGLNINASSGEVNLATSTPGIYTITYSIAASGGCAQLQTTASITITAAPSATISYSGSPFCNTGTANILLSGSSGGTYSSTSGLNINAASGEVNLTASTPGIYTVTYTIAPSGGCSQFQTTASITITSATSATISYSGSPFCNSGTANVSLTGSSGGTYSSTSGLNINAASGEVNLTASTPGIYTVTYTLAASGGCAQFQTIASINITAAPSAAISYSGSPFCNAGTANILLSGSSGGTYSSMSGLNINASSGEINLAASTPGIYTVIYTIAPSGGCAQFQTTAGITITAAPSATISYSGSPFCNAGTANVSLTGSSGGTYSSTSGLNINASSGEVNLAASTPGTYTVTYTLAASGGCAQFQTTASITITAAPSATISYSGSPFCNAGTANVTLTGSSGGTYSSTSGLNINASSGEVNLAASTPGIYTVTYTLAASGGCAQLQTTANIIIHSLPNVTVSSNSLCQGYTLTLSPSMGGTWISNHPSYASVTNTGLVTGFATGAVHFTFTETATGCSTTTNTISIKPTPTSDLKASQVDVCPNTEVTLDAHCSIPTATVIWNPGAPTVTPNAATQPYIYKASCSLDGCAGNESVVEVRTHRILVDMKDLDVGNLPLPVARAVKDNMQPANQINAPVFPRRWTFIARGCDASESAVFKLSGPVTFSSIDNAATYALFANDAGGFYSIDHPNYGNGGNFPNGTYTLTVDLRSADGVGGPFPKNRVATGSLLATRTLQFTAGNQAARTGVVDSNEERSDRNEKYSWISIFPNPAYNQVSVQLSGKIGEKVQLNLMNLEGQLLLQQTIQLSCSPEIAVLNVIKLPSGFYLLKAEKGEKVKTLKVLKAD